MRTEAEIRNRLNAFKTDLENPEKAHISPDNMAKMVPYIHALEWVLEPAVGNLKAKCPECESENTELKTRYRNGVLLYFCKACGKHFEMNEV